MLVIVASSATFGHAIFTQSHRTALLNLQNPKEEDICGETLRLSIKYAESSKVVS